MKHPGPEVTLTPEKVPVFQNSEKGVLDEVLTQVLIFAETVKKANQRLFVALKEQTQSVQITVPDLDHQRIIRKRFQIRGKSFQVGKLGV